MKISYRISTLNSITFLNIFVSCHGCIYILISSRLPQNQLKFLDFKHYLGETSHIIYAVIFIVIENVMFFVVTYLQDQNIVFEMYNMSS